VSSGRGYHEQYSATGQLHIRVDLWYQPIGFRWARNLAPYKAAEPQRILHYYVRVRLRSHGDNIGKG